MIQPFTYLQQRFVNEAYFPLPEIPAGGLLSSNYQTLTPEEFAARKAGRRVYVISGRSIYPENAMALNNWGYNYRKVAVATMQPGVVLENLASTMADGYNDLASLNAEAVRRYNASNKTISPIAVALLGAAVIGGAIAAGYATAGGATSGLAYGGAGAVAPSAATVAAAAPAAAQALPGYSLQSSTALQLPASSAAPVTYDFGIGNAFSPIMDTAGTASTAASGAADVLGSGMGVTDIAATAQAVAGAGVAVAGLVGGAPKSGGAPLPVMGGGNAGGGISLLLVAALVGGFILLKRG